MRRALLLALVAAMVVAPAVGSWPGPPPVAAPHSLGPPAAWLETETRSNWLKFSTFCWQTKSRGLCADYAWPSSSRGLPRFTVPQGSPVRLHLGFVPTEVHATTRRGGSFQPVSLPARRVVTWRPTASGIVSFGARAGHNDASYVAAITVTP